MYNMYGGGEEWQIINTGKGGCLLKCSANSGEKGLYLSHCFNKLSLTNNCHEGERFVIYVHKGKIQIRCTGGESEQYVCHSKEKIELLHRDKTNENNSLWKIT